MFIRSSSSLAKCPKRKLLQTLLRKTNATATLAELKLMKMELVAAQSITTRRNTNASISLRIISKTKMVKIWTNSTLLVHTSTLKLGRSSMLQLLA